MLREGFSVTSVLLLLPSVSVAYITLKIFYNLILHPLRSFPGPLLARASVITYQRELIQGRSHKWLKKLHEEYGPVVRCSPNELSFIEPDVWRDVYGHQAASFTKSYEFYGPDAFGSPPGILRADNISHAWQRRLVSHAFSDKALRDQESMLKGYVALLIERLHEAVGKGAVDMVEWYNFITFDIMADLTFGESLGQLDSSNYNPWVKSIFSYMKVVSLTRVCRAWPGLTQLLKVLVPADVQKRRETHLMFSVEKIEKRMARKTDRPDIWTFITKHSETEGKSLLQSELHSNGTLFSACIEYGTCTNMFTTLVLAGTETTATELSGLTYLLLKNPNKLERLKKELRGAFSSFEDMTTTNLSQLTFLNACLEEGLRMYPPVPVGPLRKIPKEDAMICGHWVAGGTDVQGHNYAAFRSPSNWKDPESFVPERFLPEGETEYATDRKDALNPFSYGPRNCLGKNLAYHEMRLILASVLFHFDLELRDETDDWFDQESHIIWQKKPLFVNLTTAS